MAQLRQVGTFIGPGEAKTAAYLERELPASWVIICNKILLNPDGSAREVDFIVVGDNVVFCIDEKAWSGSIRGNVDGWTLVGRFSNRSPLNAVEMDTKRVAGLLRNNIPQLARHLNQRFVFARVILSSLEVETDFDDPRTATQVLRLQGCESDLVLADRAQRERHSVGPYRAEVLRELASLADRPAVPDKVGDYTVFDVLPSEAGLSRLMARHPDGSERVLQVIERPETLLPEKRAADEAVLLRAYEALKKIADLDRAPRVDPYFTISDEAQWVIASHVPAGRTLRALRLAGETGPSSGLAADAFGGLAEIHALGVIHRGISPDSVYIGDDGRVRFDDFHLARIEGERSLAPALDSVEETDPYAAPELRLGLGFAEYSSDVFSLAATLLYFIKGQEPSPEQAAATRLATNLRDVDQPLVDVLRACLLDDDLARPSAVHVASRLGELQVEAASDQEDPFTTGNLIEDQYRVIRMLGRGSSAITVLAEDELGGGQVVLKVIGNPELKLLLARAEFRALRDLAHPSLPRVLDIRPPAARFHVKLEYVEGVALSQMRHDGKRDPEVGLKVLRDLSNLLMYLEERSYVHRDISPGNVVVSPMPDDPVRLIDFGLAAAVGDDSALVGTPLYRAPEIDAGAEWTPLADQYSLAIVVIEYLTDHIPFVVDGTIPRKRDRLPLHALSQGMAEDLVRILDRASEPEPSARYPTNRSFAEAVLAFARTFRPVTDQAAPSDDPLDAIESIPGLGIPGARYELDADTVQHGGIADVFRGSRIGTDEPVALKLVRGTADQPRLVQLSFERELGALRRLEHENIVSLIDAGKDGRTGEYFLVLEWLPVGLDTYLQTNPSVRKWEVFGRQIAQPIASALAYAHEHRVVHRDLKPSNVLMSAARPKLADFGIAALKTALPATSDTLVEFMSRPFSPPERSSSAEYDRDVFGFGVLVIACLSDEPILDYPDLEPALKRITVPDPVRLLLSRCISFEPTTRPQNGLVLVAELETLLASGVISPKRELMAALTGQRFRAELLPHATAEGLSVEEYIEQDLELQPFGRLQRTEEGERHVFLYGQRWSYRSSIAPNAPRLDIFAGREESVAQLDLRRSSGAVLPFTVKLTRLREMGAAGANLEAFVDFIEGADERRLDELYEKDEQRLLTGWHNQLRALEAIENDREDPIAYRSGRIEGRRFYCSLMADHPDDLVGQQRLPARSDRPLRQFSGTVERHSQRQVVLLLNRVPEAEPPKSGSLVLDTAGTITSLRRQRDALNAVRFKSALLKRGDLTDLILHPDRAAEPVALAVDAWVQPDLAPDKQRAVRLALGSRDFFAVKGPPGTGKTAFIAELIAQELRRNRDARILVTSQTNVALDNALERLLSIVPPGVRMVRLSSAVDTRVDESVQHLLLEPQMTTWRKEVRRKSESNLQGLMVERGVDVNALRAGLNVEALIEVREERKRAALLGDHDGTEPGVLDLSETESRGDVSRRRHERDLLEESIAKAIGVSRRQIQQTTPADLRKMADSVLSAASASDNDKSLLGLHLDWVGQVAGRGAQFEEPLLYGSQVLAATCVGLAGIRAAKELEFDLCILDEASKASATESLVPLVRSQRWVLVGDENQLGPFEQQELFEDGILADYDLDPTDLRHTLFDRMRNSLPPSNRMTLTTQHRMVKPVGDLIGTVFYGGALESVNDEAPLNLGLALPKAVTWFDTSRISAHGERSAAGTSFANDVEAAAIATFAERLSFTLQSSKKADRLSFLAIAAYRPQVDLIESTLRPRQDRVRRLDIDFNTVDAAQGREADVVAYSVTRSNARGAAGFLKDRRRINVALSRARYGLAVFGDVEFCTRNDGPLQQVIQYIREHPESCHIEVLE